MDRTGQGGQEKQDRIGQNRINWKKLENEWNRKEKMGQDMICYNYYMILQGMTELGYERIKQDWAKKV